jgi:hypothetical protein
MVVQKPKQNIMFMAHKKNTTKLWKIQWKSSCTMHISRFLCVSIYARVLC